METFHHIATTEVHTASDSNRPAFVSFIKNAATKSPTIHHNLSLMYINSTELKKKTPNLSNGSLVLMDTHADAL